jgi:cytochrome c553
MHIKPVLAGVVLILATSGCGDVEPTSAQRFTATGEIIALSGGDAGATYACIACHGIDGTGNGAGAPRLAGLDAGYMQRQLGAYADGRRHHILMGHVAQRLSWQDRRAVSDFYAALPPAKGGTAPSKPHPLYVGGDPARGIQPCAMCHGSDGGGGGPANPPLAGQPAPYLAEQLNAWAISARRSDPLNVMQQISVRLTPGERTALAEYASALPGGALRPEYPATFPATRRDDPRNDASVPRSHEAAQ